jgi:hypothetical protein
VRRPPGVTQVPTSSFCSYPLPVCGGGDASSKNFLSGHLGRGRIVMASSPVCLYSNKAPDRPVVVCSSGRSAPPPDPYPPPPPDPLPPPPPPAYLNTRDFPPDGLSAHRKMRENSEKKTKYPTPFFKLISF